MSVGDCWGNKITEEVTKHYQYSKEPVLFEVDQSGFSGVAGECQSEWDLLVCFFFFLLSRQLNILKDISGISFPL